MSSAVLVAGGAGALGGAVVAELLAAGRPVTATYRREAERDRTREAFVGAASLDLVRATCRTRPRRRPPWPRSRSSARS